MDFYTISYISFKLIPFVSILFIFITTKNKKMLIIRNNKKNKWDAIEASY